MLIFLGLLLALQLFLAKKSLDDIAYSVLDLEDSVKKELISVAELMSFIGNSDFKDNDRVKNLIEQYNIDRNWLDQQKINNGFGEIEPLSNKEIRDTQVDFLRANAIGYMVSDALAEFKNLDEEGNLFSIKKDIPS